MPGRERKTMLTATGTLLLTVGLLTAIAPTSLAMKAKASNREILAALVISASGMGAMAAGTQILLTQMPGT